MFPSKPYGMVRRTESPRYLWLSLAIALVSILLLSVSNPTMVDAGCFSATNAECNILNDKQGCAEKGANGGTTDIYAISPTAASGNTFDPSVHGGTCGWGGIAQPSCNDPNVTLSVIGGVTSASLINAAVPAGYLSGGSFKVFYTAFAYVGSGGTAQKFVGGCFKVIPSNYPTNGCPSSQDVACGLCH